MDDTKTKRCLDCQATLVPEVNWSKSNQKNYQNVCRVCFSIRGRKHHEKKLGREMGRRGDCVRGKKQADDHVEKRTRATQKTMLNSPISCVECGNDFIRSQPAQKYCGPRCYDTNARRKIAKNRSNLRVASTSKEDYRKLVEVYGEYCGICGSSNGYKDGGRLAVDHCHADGHIRGLLCHKCNTAIGLLGDDTARMQSAIKYLEGSRL